MPGRLIDADALMESVRITGTICGKYPFDTIPVKAIENAPTVDAVPVVRCKDCVFWDKLDCYMIESTRPDDFCSYGVRKGDAE